MKRTALPIALGILLSACGKLDLGGYGAAPASPTDDGAGHPVASSGGTGGASANNGGVATSAGGAPTPNDAGNPAAIGGSLARAGAAGDRAEFGAAGSAGEGGAAGEQGATGAAGAETKGSAIASRFRSCAYLPDLCGSDERSCCAANLVRGGEFVVGGVNQAEPSPIQSHVSSFYLGDFEVTVGRFQAFLDGYAGFLQANGLEAGAGAHPSIPGSGWNPAWTRQPNDPPEKYGISTRPDEIETEVTTCLEIPFSTVMWNQPVNCVSFYEAAAFCIWDGGRLPTDLEWEYAAAGGGQNRIYPWGSDEPVEGLAMFGCSANLPYKTCVIPPVGTYPAGAGLFGQLDLAGSVEEWTFDAIGNPRPIPCNDCASVAQLHSDDPRVTHGGNWTSEADSLRAANGKVMQAHWHLPMHGFRCAYDLP